MTVNKHASKSGPAAVELHLDRLARLYNSLDPSPFREKELDAAVDDYIVGAAQEIGTRPLRLVIHLPEGELRQTGADDVISAIHNHFVWREQAEQRRLHSELRRGRFSLLIGVAFLILCLGLRELIRLPETTAGQMIREGLLIVGWVAMWGPLDVFLYGWWPIAGRRRLFARLSKVEIDVRPLR